MAEFFECSVAELQSKFLSLRHVCETRIVLLAALVEAGLLTQEPAPYYWGPGPSLEHVDDTKLGVLSVYARDAEQKLSRFDDVFAKIDLFRTILNARFLNKRLTISQAGFGIQTADGSQLDPTFLSSGEQHEIVLLYELLFRVRNNSLILIDEPEISLHVAWQEAFLQDLGQMAISSVQHNTERSVNGNQLMHRSAYSHRVANGATS